MAMIILSVSVKRFSVSCMRDFLLSLPQIGYLMQSADLAYDLAAPWNNISKAYTDVVTNATSPMPTLHSSSRPSRFLTNCVANFGN